MRTGAAIVALLFLMACGTDKSGKDDQDTTTASSGDKFILKAANMMYLAVQPDSTLKANQPDPTKAEVFEKVDLGNGKSALKTSKGTYLSDDRGKNSVVDLESRPADWESFEIIALDPTKINIKTSASKYMSTDLANGAILKANSSKASDWEIFTIEAK